MKIVMRAACPKCEAVYELPAEMAARLPAAVRCATCGHVWDLSPEAAVDEAGAPAAPDATEADAAPVGDAVGPTAEATPGPEASDPEGGEPEGGETEASRAMSLPALLAVPDSALVSAARAPAVPWPSLRVQWMVSAGVLAVLILLLFALHGPIGRAWPPSLRLYAALGLTR